MNMNYTGVIIEESLASKEVLGTLNIVSTEVEAVKEGHKTPWLEKWTMHTVELSENEVGDVAKQISEALESEHAWYADFKNETTHYIIFKNKVFTIDRTSAEQYDEASKYGISLGIPKYQVDFHPEIKEWEREA